MQALNQIKHIQPVQVKHRLPYRQSVFIGSVQNKASPVSWFKLFCSRVQQSFRLMVGVHDYQTYVSHMRLKHPEQQPMTEREFHRYCLEARFPSKAGRLGKCPC